MSNRLYAAMDWLYIRGLLPAEMAIRTAGYYRRVLRRIVRGLYDGALTPDDALDRLVPLIEGQVMRGMREGLREVGRSPDDIYTDSELASLYDRIVRNEHDHVISLIEDVAAAAEEGREIGPLYQRAELWVGRYNDARNQAIVVGAPADVLLGWTYGDTEHCETCEALTGKIASAEVWRASGYRPQSPPNQRLDCGGWRCQCQLYVVPPSVAPNWDGTL